MVFNSSSRVIACICSCLLTVVFQVFLTPCSNILCIIYSHILMQHCLRNRVLPTFSAGVSLLNADNFPDSQDFFDDIMVCRWWSLSIPCNCTLRNVPKSLDLGSLQSWCYHLLSINLFTCGFFGALLFSCLHLSETCRCH